MLYSARLKNIEDTEKAKRVVAEDRKDRLKIPKDEEHLVASRCAFYDIYSSAPLVLIFQSVYRPNLKQKSDADILRDAKLEAMGLPPQEETRSHHSGGGSQMATDEAVCFTSFM